MSAFIILILFSLLSRIDSFACLSHTDVPTSIIAVWKRHQYSRCEGGYQGRDEVASGGFESILQRTDARGQ